MKHSPISMRHIGFVCALIMATGCRQSPDPVYTSTTEPALSLDSTQSTNTAQSDITSSPTVPTPIPATLTATFTPNYSPTPPFSDTSLGEDFLFGARTSDCALPCWHNLIPGDSTSADVDAMFENVLGFIPQNGSRFETHPGLEGILYTWLLSDIYDPENTIDFLWLSFLYDLDTDELVSSSLIWEYRPFDEYIYPRRILEQLGVPAYMFVEEFGVDGVETTLIYDQGIAFQITHGAEFKDDQDIEYCFGKQGWLDQSPYGTSGRAVLTRVPDTTSSPSDVTPNSLVLLADDGLKKGNVSAQDVFGMSLPELVNKVLAEDETCLSGKLN